RGIEQRAEDRGGEVAAVAAEGGLHSPRVGSDEARDDQSAFEITVHQVREIPPRPIPLHRWAQGTPFDQHYPAGVYPLHWTSLAAALLVEAVEELGGPDLAISGDEVAHVARGGPGQLHRVQDAFEVVAVAVESRQIQARGLRAQQ